MLKLHWQWFWRGGSQQLGRLARALSALGDPEPATRGAPPTHVAHGADCAWLSLDPPPVGTCGPQPHLALWWLPAADLAQLEARLKAVGRSGAFACVVVDWAGLAPLAVASRHWPRLRAHAHGRRANGAVSVWATAQGQTAQNQPRYVAFPVG